MELMDAPYERDRDVLEEVDGVVVIEWPIHAPRAADLTRTRTPHLFLVVPGAQPPDTPDELSGWIRLPAAERDIQAKIVDLRSRASIARPILGEHGILWRGTRWVALSPIEARLAAAFVARPGRVLSRARLEQTAWPDGRPSERSVDARIKALRRRVAPMGMRIHTVRGQGYIAEIQPLPPN